MARVSKISQSTDSSVRLSRTTTPCTVSTVEGDGEVYFDIRTFGSEDRVTEGHASQIMQFDRIAARQLYRALRDTFDFD